jgi:DNA invertase Pin-like site-specific DNA recombinase
MKKAAIYLRVSTADQNYDRQEVELRDLAKSRGYEIIAVFEEKKSAVLDMDTREQLTEMRKLGKKDIDCIFVWDITRLSRKASDFISLVNEFADKGICIHFKDKDIKTLDDDGKMNAMASIYLYMLGVFAQMDAENLKAKFKSGKENALRKGHSYTNIAPFGYYLQDKHLFIKEEEAEHVRNAYKLYSEGKDLQYIADIFNAKKVPLKSGKTDILWVKGTIYTMLKNTVYFGQGKLENVINKANKETKIRYFDAPAIIDKGLFDIVQSRFSLNKSQSDKGRLEPALLRGLLFCGLCTKPYVFANNNKKRVYRDSDMRANVNQRIGCKNGQLNVEKGDEAVWTSLKHIYEYEQFIKKTQEEKEQNKIKIEENIKSIIEIDKRLEDLKKRLRKANDAYFADALDADTLREYKSKFDSETIRQKSLKDELLAKNSYLQRRIETESDTRAFESSNPTLEEKRLICNDLIESIQLFSDGAFIKLLHVSLKNGLIYNIGFHSTKEFIVVFHESNDVYFNTTTRKGTIKGLKVDAVSPFPFSFDVEVSEYDIKGFIESMDVPDNRMMLN